MGDGAPLGSGAADNDDAVGQRQRRLMPMNAAATTGAPPASGRT